MLHLVVDLKIWKRGNGEGTRGLIGVGFGLRITSSNTRKRGWEIEGDTVCFLAPRVGDERRRHAAGPTCRLERGRRGAGAADGLLAGHCMPLRALVTQWARPAALLSSFFSFFSFLFFISLLHNF